MKQLTQPKKTKSVTIHHPLHPRIVSGVNGTVAGVNALAASLERSKTNV